MEVKPGYKQTEVGIFPAEWNIAPLGKHATFRTGPFGSALHKSDYTYDGVPVVNPMHIVDGKIEPTRTMTITEQSAKHLSDFRMSPGEIVIGRRGDMGRCAVVQEHQAGWLCGTGSMIIRPLNADAEFLQRVLSSPRVITRIEDTSVGTTMVNLNQSTLAGLKVQLPPLSEQRAIAAALSDVDALLDEQDRLIAKKRGLKQAAMQQLLTGQTRLPGFSGEWEVKSLGNVGTWRGGMTPSMQNPAFWDCGDFPWISSGDVKASRLRDTSQHVTSWAVRHGAAVVVPGNSIVLVTRSGILRKYLPVALLERPMAINQDIKALIPNDTVRADFLLHALTSCGDQILARCLKSGTTVESVEFPWLKAFAISIPPLDEQAAIAAILSDMDVELATLGHRRDKTRDLKQAMMQELLTGKTRLVPAGAAHA